MQTDYNKARKQKEISSILHSLDSLPLSSYNHGNNNIGNPSNSRARRTSSSSSSSGTWSIQSSNIRHQNAPSFVKKTPPEILAHIFSFLDPEGFASANLVCREWHSVASDDYAWKTAFDRFFGILSIIPRLSTSWRGEYIHRSHLLRYTLSYFLVLIEENGN
jgi:F-box-like